jgi:DNA-binding response OmpR family regulator
LNLSWWLLAKTLYLPELNLDKGFDRRNNFDGVDVIAINEITLFPDERRVLINNGPINLTSKEFDLLVYFIANKNRVIQKCIGRAPVGDSGPIW